MEFDPSRDVRPIIGPDLFSFGELGEYLSGGHFIEEMSRAWAGKAEHGRVTIVSDESPLPPYPNGWYFEGWSVAPWDHRPPGRAGPFNYPLTAIVETLPKGRDAKQGPVRSKGGAVAKPIAQKEPS